MVKEAPSWMVPSLEMTSFWGKSSALSLLDPLIWSSFRGVVGWTEFPSVERLVASALAVYSGAKMRLSPFGCRTIPIGSIRQVNDTRTGATP